MSNLLRRCLQSRFTLTVAVGAILAASFAGAGALADPLAAEAETLPCSGGALSVVAHQDDDLLFQSPDLLRDVQAKLCLRIVYVTAGDAGRPEAYWSGRERGVQAAYATMAGVADVWTSSDAGVPGHPITVSTLTDAANISLAFLRLPDGNATGGGFPAQQNQSLQGLIENQIPTIDAVDGSSTYTRDSLVDTLTLLMEISQPRKVYSLDFEGAFGDGDHSDHHGAAYLARDAHVAYATAHTFTGYVGYRISGWPPNVGEQEQTQKENAFFAYAVWDDSSCGSTESCASRSEGLWFGRQYRLGEEPGGTPGRVAGADRFETSAAVSVTNFSPGVAVVYIASGLNFPDALSGASVAAKDGGPILLVPGTDIPAVIQAEISRLQPGRIVVLGGPDAISVSVETALKGLTTGSVTRSAGPDRFATSAAISATAFDAGVPVVYVANGLNFPDALSGAPAAAREGAPVLLVPFDGIPAVVQAELERLKPGRIVVLGGPAAVSTSIEAALVGSTTGAVTRLAGADRFETSAVISATTNEVGAPVVYVSSGLNFPDALSGAPVAGRDQAPMLLVQTDGIPAKIGEELSRLRPSRIIVLGGPEAVSNSVAQQLAAYIPG